MPEGFETTEYRVKLKLLEPMLGTVPANPSIWSTHIAKKQEQAMKKEGLLSEAEIKAELEETIEGLADNDELRQGLTTFFSDSKGFFVRDYFVKGFLKSAATALKEYGKLKQLRSKVGRYVFVRPNKIYVAAPKEKLDVVERPLRAQTPLGERVCIARSESIPAGREIEFEVHCLNGVVPVKLLKELLSYGAYQGMGANRGSSYGSFRTISVVEI